MTAPAPLPDTVTVRPVFPEGLTLRTFTAGRKYTARRIHRGTGNVFHVFDDLGHTRYIIPGAERCPHLVRECRASRGLTRYAFGRWEVVA